MPNKKDYERGIRGTSPNAVRRPGPRRPDNLVTLLPGQRSGVHDPDGAPDWGSDGGGSYDPHAARRDRNGGMRFFRRIDVADREERESLGVDRLKYSWRTMTGPAPTVDNGDRVAARAYLIRLEAAIDQGGWSSSEASGLYLARKIWSARASGRDPRYDVVGNRQGALTKEETSDVKMRRIVLDMQSILGNNGRSNGD